MHVCSVGLNDLDLQGEWLVERQALWVVPPEIKEAIQGDPDHDMVYDHSAIVDPSMQDVFVFKLEDCALKALVQVLHVSVIFYHHNVLRTTSSALSITSTSHLPILCPTC